MRPKDKIVVLATVIVIVGAFVGMAAFTKSNVDAHSMQLVEHMHMRVFMMHEGKAIAPPAGIGISEGLWVDRSLKEYGLQEISPIHTHYGDAVVHIEANVHRNWTLGEFLDIWGQDFDGTYTTDCAQKCESMIISDYANHVFVDGETIRIYLGGEAFSPDR